MTKGGARVVVGFTSSGMNLIEEEVGMRLSLPKLVVPHEGLWAAEMGKGEVDMGSRGYHDLAPQKICIFPALTTSMMPEYPNSFSRLGRGSSASQGLGLLWQP